MKNWLREFFKSKEQKRLEQILSRHHGGIYKRIDENRELLELLQAKAPEFLAAHPWVVGSWLNSADGFLTDLEKVMVVVEPQFAPKQFGHPFPRPKSKLLDAGWADITEAMLVHITHLDSTIIDPQGDSTKLHEFFNAHVAGRSDEIVVVQPNK